MRVGSRRLWMAALAVLALASITWWTSGRKPPRLPADADHVFTQAEAHCLTCHAYRTTHPRPPNHPLRDDCFSCHRDPAGDLHPRRAAPTEVAGGWRDDPRLAGRAAAPTVPARRSAGSPAQP
ncbi:MAG: hypothetical protein ACHQQS_16990 [Thermoanaerobaculales bacterium]